ncbi:hypothetical protein MTR_2g102410 [Medicago truncatula]|uniref:Uncharacterized protein n=1 Tax=Medicago truncatula TaxID=3880 RepID=G7II64_MEDTR|nr:hypothetical protein MTR_2g102410 [Medicago truncatula]
MFCEKLNKRVDVPEWLSGMTRNHVGFARAGSNPAVHVSWTPPPPHDHYYKVDADMSPKMSS